MSFLNKSISQISSIIRVLVILFHCSAVLNLGTVEKKKFVLIPDQVENLKAVKGLSSKKNLTADIVAQISLSALTKYWPDELMNHRRVQCSHYRSNRRATVQVSHIYNNRSVPVKPDSVTVTCITNSRTLTLKQINTVHMSFMFRLCRVLHQSLPLFHTDTSWRTLCVLLQQRSSNCNCWSLN